MNEHQEIAEKRERAQQAAHYLREEGDFMTEASQAMGLARRAYDAITMAEHDSPEVIFALMEHVAEASSILDDVLSELYEIMEPEEAQIEREGAQAAVDAIEARAKVLFERYAHRVGSKAYRWEDLTPALRESWMRMAARTPEEEGSAS